VEKMKRNVSMIGIVVLLLMVSGIPLLTIAQTIQDKHVNSNKGPDLIIKRVYHAPYKNGDYFWCVVKNSGDEPIKPGTKLECKMTIKPTWNNKTLYETTGSVSKGKEISPGGTVEIALPAPNTLSGLCRCIFEVDYNNIIDEINEWNNIAQRIFFFPAIFPHKTQHTEQKETTRELHNNPNLVSLHVYLVILQKGEILLGYN